MSENKRCPFCNGKVDPRGWLGSGGVRGPECDGCGATALTIEAWEKRAGDVITTFGFGNVVVVEGNLVGVVCKLWGQSSEGREPGVDVYVRSLNAVKCYPQSAVRHYIYDKELTKRQQEYYR